MKKGKWRLKVAQEFSASHAIRDYKGKCERLHGHNFGVEVEVEGDRIDERTGMLMDFTELKAELRAVLEAVDHSHLNECPMFTDASPSSENVALYIYTELKIRLKPHMVDLVRVTVSEKPGQSATYMEV
jgi:6-pyruvoyltetrahydropterin/6-carboxytetrahydropterin synthase